MLQVRKTLSDADHDRFVILDRDSKFSREVIELLESSGRTAWRNGGSAVPVGSVSITSSHCMKRTSGG